MGLNRLIVKNVRIGSDLVWWSLSGILVPRDNSEVVYAELGSPVTLPCIFSNEFLLSSSSWKRVPKALNQLAMLPDSFNISSNPGASRCSSVPVDRSAYIQSVQNGDEGAYSCSGQVKGDNSKRVMVERKIELVTAQGKCQNSSASIEHFHAIFQCRLAFLLLVFISESSLCIEEALGRINLNQG